MNDRYQEHRTPTVTSAACEQADTRVDRAQSELKHGRALRVIDREDGAHDAASPGCVVVAVEALSATRLRWLQSLGAPVCLLLTLERALALGMEADASRPLTATTVRVPLSADSTLETVQGLAAVTASGLPTLDACPLPVESSPVSPTRSRAMDSALRLAKQARLIPALLVVEAPPSAMPSLLAEQLLWVCSADVSSRPLASSMALRRISDAQVPIAAHDDCELVLFREDPGGAEHVAIIVGHPDFSLPVAVRLHSSCLTGDLLGSLRCDCGDQLRRAIERLAESGGVLLYLEQEGRSIGLANKLRAYRLQDDGLDTIDADRYLGFLADERDYGAAVAMLKSLGIARIRLLTNNPKKIAAMSAGGIEVVERLALHGEVNAYNARYIETKQERAGHLKED